MAKFQRSRSLKSIFVKRERPIHKLSYDNYWTGKPSFLHPRYQAIESVVTPQSTVLDVGCGDGTLLRVLREAKNISGVGMDLSEKALTGVREMGFKGIQADLDGDDFELTDTYDHIVISEVIEHVKHSEALLLKLSKHARKSVIVTIPNTGYIIDRLSLLFGTFPTQWIQHPGEHLRFWTQSDFVHALRYMGFDKYRCQSVTGKPVLHKVWPSLFSKQLLFVLPANQ